MDEMKAIFFAIGTLAFFVVLYLAIQHPELAEGPMGEEKTESSDNPLRKWDRLAYWIMWTGWALTAIAFYIDKAKLADKLF